MRSETLTHPDGNSLVVASDPLAPHLQRSRTCQSTPNGSSTAKAPSQPVPPEGSCAADHFVERGGAMCAGTHLLMDLWGASHLDDIEYIEGAMRRAVDAAGATLLHLHFHQFGGAGGVSGVAVLAESHISVHSWPERGFAAFDVFMCGKCRPERAAEEIRRALGPARTDITIERRGVVT